MEELEVIQKTFVRINIKWLDGGLEDEFFVLTPYPIRLEYVADALSEPRTNCGDEAFFRVAGCLREVRDGHVVANSSTRFAAVCGCRFESDPPRSRHIIEIQELLVAGVRCVVEPQLGDHLVSMGLFTTESPRKPKRLKIIPEEK